MRTIRSIVPMFAGRLAAPFAIAALALTLGTAAPALATASASSGPAPAGAEVCAPGAMTITRGGPTVYDGVDCTPGPMAGGAVIPSTGSPSPDVPSGTELRPAITTAGQPSAGMVRPAIATLPSPARAITRPAAGSGSVAAAGAWVVAAFAAAMALFHISRSRQATLRTAGAD